MVNKMLQKIVWSSECAYHGRFQISIVICIQFAEFDM